MDKYLDIFENLIKFKDEYEWLDFKENWFSKDELENIFLLLQMALRYRVGNTAMWFGESAILAKKSSELRLILTEILMVNRTNIIYQEI